VLRRRRSSRRRQQLRRGRRSAIARSASARFRGPGHALTTRSNTLSTRLRDSDCAQDVAGDRGRLVGRSMRFATPRAASAPRSSKNRPASRVAAVAEPRRGVQQIARPVPLGRGRPPSGIAWAVTPGTHDALHRAGQEAGAVRSGLARARRTARPSGWQAERGEWRPRPSLLTRRCAAGTEDDHEPKRPRSGNELRGSCDAPRRRVQQA